MRHLRLIAFALVALLAGCIAPPQALTVPVPDLIVARSAIRENLELPAGRYVAVSRDARGIFYQPQGSLFMARPRLLLTDGGVWRSDDGKSWGYWLNQGQVFPFTEPLELAP
jgi:hypothetical protein